MKKLLQVVTAFLLCQANSEASIIYQNDFSGTTLPGWMRATVGDNAFHQVWSVTSGLESESGKQHARYDFNIPTLPSDPNTTKWYGGFADYAGAFTALPAQWQLSFDIFLNTLEPIEVNFTFQTGKIPNPQTTINYWVEPANVGWQPIVINQNSTSSGGFGGGGPQMGTYLSVALASQDPNGNPLSISHIGTYDFLLDNVVLQSVPEPLAPGLYIMAGALFVGMRQYRRPCWSHGQPGLPLV